MRLKLILFALIILCSPSLQAQNKTIHFKPGQYEESLIHDNLRRTYVLHIPPQYDSE